MVGRTRVWDCVSWNCREQRKLAPKMVCWLPLTPSSNRLAMVYTMVVLPEPAWPVSQKTRELANEQSLAHSVMSFNILTRVPSVHASRFRPCSSRTVLWSAFLEGSRRCRAAFCDSISVGHKPGNRDTCLDVVVYHVPRFLDAVRHFELGSNNEKYISSDEYKSMHLEGRRSPIYALKNLADHLLVFFIV